MELWIGAGLIVAGLVAIFILRVRSRRRIAPGESGNVYPLW